MIAVQANGMAWNYLRYFRIYCYIIPFIDDYMQVEEYSIGCTKMKIFKFIQAGDKGQWSHAALCDKMLRVLDFQSSRDVSDLTLLVAS